jgi:hypothetical protein
MTHKCKKESELEPTYFKKVFSSYRVVCDCIYVLTYFKDANMVLILLIVDFPFTKCHLITEYSVGVYMIPINHFSFRILLK